MSSRTLEHFILAQAGCDPVTLKKLHIVAGLFSARIKQVRIRDWTGPERSASTDLLVANLDDPAGQDAARQAQLAHRPALLVSQQAIDVADAVRQRSISPSQPVFDFFRLLEELLTGTRASTPTSAPSHPLSGLLQSLQNLQGTVQVQQGPFQVLLDRSSGFCLSRTHSDLIEVASALREGQPSLTVKKVTPAPLQEFDVRTSIENFVFGALLHHDDLSVPMEQPVQLSGWPDIHCAELGIELAHLSTLLCARPTRPSDLVDSFGPRCIAAFLVACRCAGLLQDSTHAASPADTGTRRRTGLMSALGRWLGLKD